jgi:hypothetical protein
MLELTPRYPRLSVYVHGVLSDSINVHIVSIFVAASLKPFKILRLIAFDEVCFLYGKTFCTCTQIAFSVDLNSKFYKSVKNEIKIPVEISVGSMPVNT